jgi:hypothetical protein
VAVEGRWERVCIWGRDWKWDWEVEGQQEIRDWVGWREKVWERHKDGWEDEEDRVVMVEEKEVAGVNTGGAVGRGWRGAIYNMSKLCREVQIGRERVNIPGQF